MPSWMNACLLPGCWFTEAYRQRWKTCRIPEEVRFQTEPQLALEMIRELIARAVIPFRWVTADAGLWQKPRFSRGNCPSRQMGIR